MVGDELRGRESRRGYPLVYLLRRDSDIGSKIRVPLSVAFGSADFVEQIIMKNDERLVGDQPFCHQLIKRTVVNLLQLLESLGAGQLCRLAHFAIEAIDAFFLDVRQPT